MNKFLKTVAVAFALVATSAAFAANTVIIDTDTQMITDTATKTFIVPALDTGVFVQVVFTSTKAVTVVAPAGFTTTDSMTFNANAFVPSANEFKVSADTASATDSIQVVATVGVAKFVSQYSTVAVTAATTFAQFGVGEFSSKPKIWGEVKYTNTKGKAKVKKLAFKVTDKITKRDTTLVANAEMKGVMATFDKKALSALYKSPAGSSLIAPDADTALVGFTFQDSKIKQAPLRVTVKATTKLVKPTKAQKDMMKPGIEVVGFELASPIVSADTTFTVKVDTNYVVDTAGTSDPIPVLVLDVPFTIEINNLGVLAKTNRGATKYSTKLKAWVENKVTARNQNVSIKKVNLKVNMKTLKPVVGKEGVYSVQVTLKKAKNFTPSVKGDVSALVIETPVGIDAIQVVILDAE